MRRSLRDAIVGFSLIGGVVVFAGSMFWLRGIRIGSNTWEVTANFANASGLAKRSPVTYRGIHVGSVKEVKVTPQSVRASLEINKSDLLLPKPVFAKVIKSSLLGGDVQVALVGSYKSVSKNIPMPGSDSCPNQQILCGGDVIKGEPLTSISNLTAELEKILLKATKEDVVTNLSESTKQFDRTQRELEVLVLDIKSELNRAGPIISELNIATKHLKNILAAIDNPKTLEDIRRTASSTRSLTRKMDQLGSDMSKLMEDEALMDAFRSVTIGLGQLFDEIYPSNTRKLN